MNRPFSLTFLITVIPRLLPYLRVTFWVMGGTIFFGFILGLLLAKAKLQGNTFFKALAYGYTWTLRCTPSIVLLFIVFYGLPKVLLEMFGININSWNRGFFVITTFSLLFAATFSEIMRSAYLAIEKGQYEAAVSIGLSPFQAFHRIVLPQAVVVALPNLGNSCIKLMQEGAFAFTVGLVDVMWQNTLIIFRNYGAYAMETYLALALLYWLLTIGLEKSFLFLEARLSRGRKAWA